MLGTSNDNRRAVVINNSVLQPFESASINDYTASSSPFLVETSLYQTNVDLEPVVLERKALSELKVIIKWPISMLKYNGNQLMLRRIHNASLLDKFLLEREKD